MSRKPLKKIKLTDDEFNVVEKIADLCKASWFSIAGDTVELWTGKVCPRQRNEYDECYDLDAKRYISLQYGLKLLGESFSDDLDCLELTDDEKKTWRELLKRI